VDSREGMVLEQVGDMDKEVEHWMLGAEDEVQASLVELTTS
jgi:hypothetical protein